MNKKEQLIKQTYSTLQSTEEYKYFLDTFVYNQSVNMTIEVDYILKKSFEDSEAPFSYDDLEQYDKTNFKEDCINKVMDEFINLLEEEQEEKIKETNEEYNRKIKTIGDYEVFLKSLDEEDLRELAEMEYSLFDSDYLNPVEVYQWFIMDDRLLYQLEKRGEVVLNDKYWGRQCFGQSIEMDGVIIEIFKEWFLNLNWIENKYKLLEEV